MTTAQPTPAPPTSPTRTLGGRGGWHPPRWVVMAVVLGAALLVGEGALQAVAPFIRNDDWPYLLPVDTPGAIDNYAKNLREGRWLNYLWWLGIGQHTTPFWASLTFVAAYAVFVAGLWRLLWRADHHSHWAVQALLGLALFSSVVWVLLLYWPATQVSSALVAAAGVWTLPLASRGRTRFTVWLLAVTVLSMLTYPPVAALLFLTAVVHLGRMPWRRLLLLSLGWVASFAAGVAVIYAVNWFAFGYFGLHIASWRHPNPASSLHALRVNASRSVHALIAIARLQPLATATAVVAVVAGALSAVVRPLMTRLAAGLAVVLALGVAQTLLTGVTTSVRGELWLWLAVVLPAALLLRHPGVTSRVGVACLAVLAVIGTLAWRADVGAHQDTRREYAAIVADATRARPDGSRPQVVIYQDPHWRTTVRGSTMAGTMRMMVREAQDGVVPRWCSAQECRQIAARAGEGPVVRLGSVVGIVVPRPPAWI